MSADTPNFHDAHLVGIQLLEGEVRLSLTRYNGQRWEVGLHGVKALLMDDFRLGNIISVFQIVQGSRPDYELLERLFPGPHPAAAQQYLTADASLLEAKAALVEAAQAAVVSIVPSYGADLVAYVSGVSATQVEP